MAKRLPDAANLPEHVTAYAMFALISFVSPLRRVAGLIGFALLALTLLAFPRAMQAQREQVVARVEQYGGTSIARPVGTQGPGTFDAQAVQLTLAQRFVRGRGTTMMIAGAQWRAVRVPLPRATTVAAGANDVTTLHTAFADLMLLRTVGDRHTVVGVLRPGLYGDDLRAEGAVFVDRIVSPRTTVGAGLSFASTFGQLLPIPVVHVVSRASRRVLVDALLPSRADVWYMPRKGLDFGLNASLSGALYGLTDTQQRVGGVLNATAFGLANATIGPQLRLTPRGGKWQLTADAGTTVLRRAEYVRGGRTLADLAPGNVPYVRFGAQRLF